jgi:hypothetical protein
MGRIFFFACLLLPGFAFALDFGIVIYQNPFFGTPEISGDDVVEYTGFILPWVSVFLREDTEIYVSGGLRPKYERFDLNDDGREWGFIPDIGRFELSFLPGTNLSLHLGRFAFSDSLGFVFSGLFDGFGATWNIGGTRLKTGAFYTGLLYKKADYIIMSNSDLTNYYDGDVYFASRRLAFAVNWEATSFLDTRNQLDLGALAQFDLNDSSDTLHSQYLLIRWRRSLGRGWYTDIGTVFDIEERNDEGGIGFAFSLTPFLVPPRRPYDRLFFNARFSSGNWSDRVRSFKPVTTEAQGQILRTKISGLSLLELGYTIRLFPKLEGEAVAGYFFRTDRETFYDPDLDSGSGAAVLGGELFACLRWAPESWCSVGLGLGFFLPQTGGAYKSQAENKWHLETSLALSF